MKSYRRYNGQFITKAAHERRIIRRFYAYLSLFAVCVCVGIIAETSPVEYIAPKAEAHGPSIMEPIDLCDLVVVECEHENEYNDMVNEVPHNSSVTSDRIRTVYRMADESGVSGDVLMHIAWCESMLWNVQSGSHYTFSSDERGIVEGEQEMSYGWFMIHTPDHKVSPEQAYDVSFATSWAIEQIKNGNYPWYGYDSRTDRCANDVVEYWE